MYCIALGCWKTAHEVPACHFKNGFKDLKTLRGVANRIAKLRIKSPYTIFQYTEWYNDDTFKVIKTVK